MKITKGFTKIYVVVTQLSVSTTNGIFINKINIVGKFVYFLVIMKTTRGSQLQQLIRSKFIVLYAWKFQLMSVCYYEQCNSFTFKDARAYIINSYFGGIIIIVTHCIHVNTLTLDYWEQSNMSSGPSFCSSRYSSGR